MRNRITLLSSLLLWFAACSGARPDAPEAPAAPASATPEPTAAAAATTAPDTTMPTNPPPAVPAKTETATLANGCFWCTEAVLEQLDGVLDVTSGYMGGRIERPTYQQVCSGTTGHAECVQVTFDPARISYDKLLAWFFASHDPTTKDRQGADVGTQYRSAIFFHSPEQEKAAHAAIAKAQPEFDDPIVTEVTAASTFWPAEQYHQGYYQANPREGYCRVVIAPKLKKLGLDVEPKPKK